jgi:hypothetical protein
VSSRARGRHAGRATTWLPACLAALVVCAAALAGCAAAATGGAADPAPRRLAAAEHWITLGDFRWVAAVGVSIRTAYFGTTAGLERWDTLRETWLAPLTTADGLPDDRVTALAVEPLDGGIWIGTRRGLARLVDGDDRVDPVWGPPPAPVRAILLDPDDGAAYALVAGRWWGGRGGSLAPIDGPPADAGESSAPAADLDPAEVPWIDPLYARGGAFPGIFRLTRVARDPRGDWYAGTWGDNARRWRAGGAEGEPLYLGVAGVPGGPLARAASGTWFLPAGEAEGRAALAHASADLAIWSYVVPVETPALPSAVAHAALALGDTLVVGTDFGLAWGVGPMWGRSGREAAVGAVRTLAADGPIVWVGGEDGLHVWDRATGRAARASLPRARVTALAVTGDALFVGTDVGLWAARRPAPPGSPAGALAQAEGLVRVEPAGRSVHALALHGELLLVADERGLEVFDRRAGTWRAVPIGEGRLDAVPLAIASDGENAWIGTERGLIRWRPATDEWRAYGHADGLAGVPVRHLLAEPDAVWASTPAGVSRFAWREAEP